MAGLTKEQRAAKLQAQKIAEAGLTQEQFEALNDEDKAKIIGVSAGAGACGAEGGDGEGAGDEAADDGIKYVRMTRDPEFYDAPHEAKVHPKEVTNYARGGWEIA
jgi:hypothetical protein